jgi:hypothetical protein
VRATAAEKFSMLLVSVLFTENIDVSDGFWGLTKNYAFKLWNQRVTLYRAQVTNWSTKTEEANQKYRQMQNKEYVSIAEGQAWIYNHCAASFDKKPGLVVRAKTRLKLT